MHKVERLKGLYVITDPKLTPSAALIDSVTAALQGGARVVQYRDKSCDTEKRLREARALKALCDQYQATFIVNDDVSLAQASDAHGVHLGLDDTAISAARQQLGPSKIIGGTCHGDVGNAYRAQDDGADYVAFGRFFPSPTKPDAPPANLGDIAPRLQTLDIPAVAIGGITLANAPQLRAAGFAMLAVIADVFDHPDIQAQCARYTQLFE